MKVLKNLQALFPQLLHRYKYVLAVVGVGLLLLIWPVPGKDHADPIPSSVQSVISADSGVSELEEDLETLLSRAEGVGNVAVRLSVSAHETVEYAQEVESSCERSYAEGFLADERIAENRKTQIVDSADREEPVVISRKSPTYLGALVICDGADQAAVRYWVIQAVSSMTGLGTDRIVVMKMKD